MIGRKPIGFLVWNPSRTLPTFQHETYARAEAEAERLRAENPGETFWVMSPVASAKAGLTAKAFSDGKAEGLAQAHAEIMLAEGRTDRLSDELHALRRSTQAFADIERKKSEFQAIVADCLLWFEGFRAAYANKASWKRPFTPDREKLAALNGALQALLRTSDEEEIPF